MRLLKKGLALGIAAIMVLSPFASMETGATEKAALTEYSESAQSNDSTETAEGEGAVDTAAPVVSETGSDAAESENSSGSNEIKQEEAGEIEGSSEDDAEAEEPAELEDPAEDEQEASEEEEPEATEEQSWDIDNETELFSLLPLEEDESFRVDLTDYSPVELTKVYFKDIFTGAHSILKNMKIAWSYYRSDDYKIATISDYVSLLHHDSINTIKGDGDQLNPDNKRQYISFSKSDYSNWIIPSLYLETADGSRTPVEISWNDFYTYSDYATVSIERGKLDLQDTDTLYVGLAINEREFSSPRYDSIKVFEGSHKEDELSGAKDITSAVLGQDISQSGKGFSYDMANSNNRWLTFVTYDGSTITGCLPVRLSVYGEYIETELEASFDLKDEYGTNAGYDHTEEKVGDTVEHRYKIYNDINYDSDLYLTASLYGADESSDKVYAFEGKYKSLEEAQNASAKDIKNSLFRIPYEEKGYLGNFSKGKYITIIADEKVLISKITVSQGKAESNRLSSKTAISFTGLRAEDGSSIEVFKVEYDEDSYGEYNYVTMFVSEQTDLTNVAPEFTESYGLRLYSKGGSSPEISGKSYHDFSKGPYHYTASAENGKNSKNYWLTIVKASPGKGQLYISSLADETAKTETKDGVVYTSREVMLDGYHNYLHDIFIANIGSENIKNLKASLDSDVLEVDEYWRLNGDFVLSPMNKEDVKEENLYNMSKVRLRAKSDVEWGTEISGTLTLSEGNEKLVVITLTGIVGSPVITTTEIPMAVQYVPYGSFIQNNNKYSWNETSYTLEKGTLPEGMIIRPNGELYGVPKEVGEFTFVVRMKNSYSGFSNSQKEFTLTVVENTDNNVESATDTGYELSERVARRIYGNKLQDTYLMVSIGEYGEFVDIFLDGDKLVPGADYTSERGSTRITINSQTLKDRGKGRHTLGIEFRKSSESELKRAAQNYEYYDKKSSGGSGSSGKNKGSSGGSSPSTNSPTSNTPVNNTNTNPLPVVAAPLLGAPAVQLPENMVVTANGNIVVFNEAAALDYAIQPGDTLWNLAARFYGTGDLWTKIYVANIALIAQPNNLKVGQVIKIYPAVVLPGGTISQSATGNSEPYVVQGGDNLWKIASRVYGDGSLWRIIYQANEGALSSPNALKNGQTLIIPVT